MRVRQQVCCLCLFNLPDHEYNDRVMIMDTMMMDTINLRHSLMAIPFCVLVINYPFSCEINFHLIASLHLMDTGQNSGQGLRRSRQTAGCSKHCCHTPKQWINLVLPSAELNTVRVRCWRDVLILRHCLWCLRQCEFFTTPDFVRLWPLRPSLGCLRLCKGLKNRNLLV